MEKSILYRKGIVSALIILFIFMSVIQSFGTIAKKSNKLIFSENSTICGFTTDFETGEPIEGAIISFFIDCLLLLLLLPLAFRCSLVRAS